MRVSCQQCSAKYTVSEEKLRHGVVRLKCKQCRTLIVVQPDGTVASGSDLIGGAAAIATDSYADAVERDSRTSSSDSAGSSAAGDPRSASTGAPTGAALDALSDTALTIPLPSLAELGLTGTGVGSRTAAAALAGSPAANAAISGAAGVSASSGVSGSAVPLPPPPPTSGARSLGPPPPPGAREGGRDSGVGLVAGEPAARLSAPPSAASVQAADLDDEDGIKPTVFNQQAPSLEAALGRAGGAPLAGGSAGPAARPVVSSPTAAMPERLSEQLAAAARTSVARVKDAPLTARGWGILGGIIVGGILVGAILAPSATEGPNSPFDESSARDALRDAVAEARHCFARPIPALVGIVDAEFGPDGEALSVEVSGGLTHVDEHRCIEDAFRAMRVKPFSGPPVHTKKTISLSFER